MATTTDTTFMRRALELAALGGEATLPNPQVGAVVVREGTIVGEGYHRRAGEDHAEVIALAKAGAAAAGATLYVTLEPCNHTGRTPPCSEAVIRAGIKKVVIASLDPNPHVAGGGRERLLSAGIEVEIGVCTSEEKALNEHWYERVIGVSQEK